jgi:hypothetical protein
MKIYTDNKWKNFKYRNEVPDKILASEFDYQDANEVLDGFFCYRKWWFHLDGFMMIDKHAPKEFQGYQGYASDSFFSGVLIRISDDGERYQVATYIS